MITVEMCFSPKYSTVTNVETKKKFLSPRQAVVYFNIVEEYVCEESAVSEVNLYFFP